MREQLTALLQHALRTWASSKGVYLVLAAMLLPLVLTGAWTLTHDADVEAVELTWSPETPNEGENVTLTARVANTGTGGPRSFNVTLAVGRVAGDRLLPDASTTERVGPLTPGQESSVLLNWTASPGGRYALVSVDPEDEHAEIDEADNVIARPLVARYEVPAPEDAPVAPPGLTGDETNATTRVSLAVGPLTFEPAEPLAGENVTLSLVVINEGDTAIRNATAVLRVVRTVSGSSLPLADETTPVDLAPGEERTLTLVWQVSAGARWAEGYVVPAQEASDVDGSDQHRAVPFAVQAPMPAEPPAPPERITIKEFYLDVLSLLHLRFLLPFVALFYAAGVLSDDRSRGNLPYILTRPVPRWAIPLTKFLAGFVIAGAATVLGLLLTFAVLFGTPGGDIGFLTTPILASLVVLVAYGGLFTALGVLVDRPYLVGLAFVVGWETVAALLVPWVEKLTLTYWIGQALVGWPLDQGVLLLPVEEAGRTALWVLLGIGAAGLAAAAYAATRREFPRGP